MPRYWYVIISILFIQLGCANPYSKFYHDFTDGKGVTKSTQLYIANENVKIIKGDNIDLDNKRMEEDGYLILGYSSFNGSDGIGERNIIRHANQIHAAFAITYQNYTNTISGNTPVTVPNNQFSSTTVNATVYGTNGTSKTLSGHAATTTYGTKTIDIPYSVDRYNCYVSYWIKIKPPVLGLNLNDLTDEIKQQIGSNKGSLVRTVIKGSPAYHSDIITGDIIKKIGDHEIYSPETYTNALKNFSDQSVDVTIIRKQLEISKNIKISKFNKGENAWM